MNYALRREELYQPLREEGIFTWDCMYDEEYALASLHLIPDRLREQLAEATERLARIYGKVLPVLQQSDSALLRELGIPEAALAACRLQVHELPTLVGRFDFAQTAEGLKMLEFNSDTPTGIVEAFHVNQHICDAYGAKNPNQGMAKQLTEAFQSIRQKYASMGYRTEHIYFSALDWHEEDKGTTLYLLNHSGLPGRFIGLEQLRLFEDRLYALQDDQFLPIDLLYRLHALEKLAEEHDTDGYPTGPHLLELIAQKKLAVINPPSAFLLQTKALQALIWNLHESNAFFTREEHETVETYMLPTYFENRFLGRERFVSKPIFGREGGGVVLHDRQGETLERDQEEFYWDQPMIYQRFVDLPIVETDTLKGKYHGHLLWGSFLINGKPSAIIARLGGRITNNLSYYLPVGLQ
ncbi:glutathionylspermidine synthase family protein [Brevibacillus fulvus]|uniref:Glutathionylspermidine synthase n=1 Tax=Brevibacillus fulvus TaxID=1125967 RepID=A0A938XZY2_9BACL|nr:glutathionylspermidine synthase family protein [Brevibacillus fulvus]MBM7590765.1 glutathionylspermidine synthase [Brevibacillus fulvus]